GRAATVGRCVSRGYSCLDSTKRKARTGVRNPGAYRVLRPFKSIDPAGIQGLCRTDRAPKAASSTMPRVPRSCRVSQKSDNHQLSPPFLATQRQACQSEKHAQSPLVRQRSRFGSRLVTTHSVLAQQLLGILRLSDRPCSPKVTLEVTTDGGTYKY